MSTQSLARTAVSVNEVAQAQMAKLSLPSLKDENFRFTPVLKAPFAEVNSSSLNPTSVDVQSFFPEEKLGALLTVQADHFHAQNVNSSEVLVNSWEDLLNLHSFERSEILPSESLGKDIFAWASMNERFSGFSLRIPTGTSVELPIGILYFFQAAAAVMRVRSIIHLEENSRLRWIAHSTGEERKNEGFIFSYQSFFLEKSAKMEGLELQNFSANTKYFVRQEFFLDQGAAVDWFWAASGHGFGQHRVHAECRGSGASFVGRRAVSLSSKDHSDFWVENMHAAPDTESSCDQWAVVDERAHSVFNALIRIPPKMFRSKASQKGKSLLLSEGAISDSLPKLIIEADDVQVAHGASISSVSEDQLYYLRSRGLDEQEARSLLIQGFLEDAWSLLESEDRKIWLRKYLQKKA